MYRILYIRPLVRFIKFLSLFKNNFETNDRSIESTNKELLDLQKHWAGYLPGGGQAPLTEKALLLLKLVWSLP